MSELVSKARERAEEVLKKHRPVLDVIVTVLLEKETIEETEFAAILRAHGIIVKRDAKKV